MKFRTKIFVITLSILVVTLLLNSVLSIGSFEKIYVSSLISTYEITGKNLKRKIERSLRFGKPLDSFQGMDQLLKEVTRKNPDITEVTVGSLDGKTLYRETSERTEGKISASMPDFSKGDQIVTRQESNCYVTSLSLYSREHQAVGFIRLSFPRNVIYQRLKIMAADNLTVLWVLMPVTSGGLILFLGIFVVRPFRRQISDISEMLEWPTGGLRDGGKKIIPIVSVENEKKTASTDGSGDERIELRKIRTELDLLGWNVRDFRAYAFMLQSNVEAFQKKLNAFYYEYDALVSAADSVRHLFPHHPPCEKETGIDEFEAFLAEYRNFKGICRIFRNVAENVRERNAEDSLTEAEPFK